MLMFEGPSQHFRVFFTPEQFSWVQTFSAVFFGLFKFV